MHLAVVLAAVVVVVVVPADCYSYPYYLLIPGLVSFHFQHHLSVTVRFPYYLVLS